MSDKLKIIQNQRLVFYKLKIIENPQAANCSQAPFEAQQCGRDYQAT
jgi:hypothetical protein